MYDYTKDDLIEALKNCGIVEGDTVLVYTGISALGMPKDVRTQDDLSELSLSAFDSVLGENGTLIVPTYTYSLGNNEIYNPKTTPCPKLGAFAEYFRKLPNVQRSLDPFLSVAIKGKNTSLIDGIASNSYGHDSIFDRIVNCGGKIVCLGLDLFWATYRHYCEEMAEVPFRYKKKFIGAIEVDDKITDCTWIYSVYPYIDNAKPAGEQLAQKLIDIGIAKQSTIGRGYINSIVAKDYLEFYIKEASQNPWCSAKGPACDILEEEEKRVGKVEFNIDIPNDSSINSLVDKLASIPCYCVSDGYDSILNALSKNNPLQIHEYPTGTEIADIIVPEKWTFNKGSLETLDGKTIFSFTDNYSYLAKASIGFSGTIDKKSLLQHVYVDKADDEAVPYISLDYMKAWGICCSANERDCFTEDSYNLNIDASFSYGSLKIGEYTIEGDSRDTFLICTMLSDFDKGNSLSVGLQLMKELGKESKRKYTYRLLILPDFSFLPLWSKQFVEKFNNTIGSVFINMPYSVKEKATLSFYTNSEPQTFYNVIKDMVAKEKIECQKGNLLYDKLLEDTPKTQHTLRFKNEPNYIFDIVNRYKLLIHFATTP